MTRRARILAFAGSAQPKSLTKRLLKVAVEGAKLAGAEVTVVDLADHVLPIHDLDGTGETPQAVQKLKTLLRQHDGLLISVSETTGSVTPLLKNTLDWLAHMEASDATCAFAGKAAGLVGISADQYGGMRALAAVSSILGEAGVLVVPFMVGVSGSETAFAADGDLKDKALAQRVQGVGQALVLALAKLAHIQVKEGSSHA